ncbi:MAG: glycoside hydrolase family 31 protein [Acidimicrobiia bacterium]|nr:glycoside hydrolase family 31 protein [Acidimicrobiia bacterium]
MQVAIEDDHLDQYVFVGDPKTILDRYTTLTGKAHVPPRWSFGWWQSKISYRSADEALDIVRRYRAADLPIDVPRLDTHWFRRDWRCDLEFDPERFPDPGRLLAAMADLGVQVSLWQLPYVPEGCALFDEIDAVGGFVQHPDGGLYDIGLCYTPGFIGARVGCIDFTNPAGVEVYQRAPPCALHDARVRPPSRSTSASRPVDGIYHDGTPGHLAHNQYPLLYNRAVAEATHDATGEWIIWARSAWAGSQRYPLHWGGDSSTNWDNLGPQFAAGLSFGASGFSFWSQDIGGFLTAAPVGGDLFVRWAQAGLLVSHARIHGADTRELDQLDPTTLEAIRPALALRYRLLPYLLGEARRSADAGLPMARPLVIEFPDDPSTWHIDDQWLLGEHLLVAPILDPSGRRRVYLPGGRWLDWWTDRVHDGNRWIEIESPLDRIPLWIREGGVVACGPAMGHVGQVPTDRLSVRAVRPSPGREGQGVVDIDGEARRRRAGVDGRGRPRQARRHRRHRDRPAPRRRTDGHRSVSQLGTGNATRLIPSGPVDAHRRPCHPREVPAWAAPGPSRGPFGRSPVDLDVVQSFGEPLGHAEMEPLHRVGDPRRPSRRTGRCPTPRPHRCDSGGAQLVRTPGEPWRRPGATTRRPRNRRGPPLDPPDDRPPSARRRCGPPRRATATTRS